MRRRLHIIVSLVAVLAAAGCAGMDRVEPFGNVESTLPDSAKPVDSGAYHGKYVPGAIIGT